MVSVAYAVNDFTSNSVDDTAWEQLSLVDQAGSALASLPAEVSAVDIGYSGGEILYIGVGSSITDAVQVLQIGPNCQSLVASIMNAGHKVFIKGAAAGVTINTGMLSLTFKHGRNF